MTWSVFSLAVWHPMSETIHLKWQLRGVGREKHLWILFWMAICKIINLNNVFPKHFLINSKNQDAILWEHMLEN